MNIEGIEKINKETDQEFFPDIPYEQFWVQGVYKDLSRERWCFDWSGVKEYVKHLEKKEGLKILRIIPFIACYQKRYDYRDNKRDKGARIPIRYPDNLDPFILDEQEITTTEGE